jgi:prolyl-tRNA editing enzyme YbaK/EbsC (Cys-tRNA(Pro) deacylase)
MTDAPDPEAAVLATLDALGVAYERIPCNPALADTAAFCEHYGEPLDHAANTIVVASKKKPRRFAACVVLATRSLDVNRRVRDLVGAGRLSFARPEHMLELTGMMVGGVTPFSLPEGLPLYLDGAMMDLPWVIVGTGGRSGKLRLAPQVLASLPEAQVIDDLSTPRPPA